MLSVFLTIVVCIFFRLQKELMNLMVSSSIDQFYWFGNLEKLERSDHWSDNSNALITQDY